MSDTYWEGEWPNLASISIALPLGLRIGVKPSVTGVMFRLVSYLASRGVHRFYDGPDLDPSLPASPKELRKIAQCTRGELADAEPYFEVLFEERDGRLRLIDETVVRYTRPMARAAIGRDAKAAVAARHGLRCVYCGSIQGPFHNDHLFPVSRGGSNDVSNLVIACASCNLSKSDRTLLEWVEYLRARS